MEHFFGGTVVTSGFLRAVSRFLDPQGVGIELMADIPLETSQGVTAQGDSLVAFAPELTAGTLWHDEADHRVRCRLDELFLETKPALAP